MKKTFFWLAAALSASAVFASCDKEKDKDKAQQDEDPRSAVVYDADEQKTKLQDIALELLGKFNPDDQRQAVELADYLGGLYEDYDWDFSQVEDHYKEDYGFLYSMTAYVAQGDVTANFANDLLEKAAGQKTVICKFTKIDAEWEADETAHVWRYKGQGDGGLILKFKGPNNVACEARLTGEDSDITYTGTYEVWDSDIRAYRDVTFDAALPKKVNFSLKEGSVELTSTAMNFDVQKSDHFNFDFTTTITNITIVRSVKIGKDAAGCVYAIKLGNENLIRAVADVQGLGLVDKASYQDWEDWYDMYADMWDNYDVQLGKGVAQVDILDGKLTLKTSTTDGTQFVKDCDALWDKYDYESGKQSWEQYYNLAPYNKDWANLYNKFMKADLYYGESKSVQAQLKWDAYYEDREYWNWETQGYEMHQIWDYAPMIYFPSDATTYNFGKYFTQKAFNRVINSTESFINSYIRLSKRWGEGNEIEL